jgi:capsular exopolysaccharide synthesis family protein
MNDLNLEQNDGMEIDLKRLMDAVLGKAWLIGIVSLLMAVLTFVGTFLFVTPLYQSAAMFYVNNSDISVGNTTLSLTSSDISASRGLVDTYIVILGTRETLLDVIDYAEADLSYTKLKNMIQAEAVDDTEVFRVTITSPDPAQAEQLANAVAYILPKRISNIIEGTSAKVVDAAVIASRPSSPNYTKNTLLGFLIGLVLSVGIVVLRTLFDITIRTEEDIAQSCKAPVLAAVPDMEHSATGGYYYGYISKERTKATTGPGGKKQKVLVGSNISFAAAEAYKLLRTKLQFSFADEGNCRVIGISSALSGEGKTLSAVNLAYSISQLGKRVLLIDCDMRRPSLAEKLPIKKTPGLSDYLVGQIQADHLIQLCGILEDEQAFHAISSGRTPPNPMELLSSARMEKMMQLLRGNYDYIVLDLPPVGEVSDALVAAKLTDGMLLVVRHDYCDRISLNNAVRQFEFVDAKILGVVFNGTEDSDKTYAGKYRYRAYKKTGRDKRPVRKS